MMGRLIDKDALPEHKFPAVQCKGFGGGQAYRQGWNDAIDAIVENEPTVDAVPVRHGRWIKKRYWSNWYGMGESYGYWYKCSECGGEVKGGYESCDNKFCRNCGADMREDGDNG